MIFSLDHIANPYPVLAAARMKHPVFWDEGLNAWIVLEHDLVAQAFKDAHFS